MFVQTPVSFIDESHIAADLAAGSGADATRVREILAKARGLGGLTPAEVAALMPLSDPQLLAELFDAARYVKDEIYGKRLVLFAPLYISNYCRNECVYCAFRARNKSVVRRALSQEEIAREVKTLIGQGHKRLLLVAGESYPQEGFEYVLKAIETVYSVGSSAERIRRVNVNIAPLSTEQFRQLKSANIGTYQLFQETYHRETYGRVHLAGAKRDFDWRVSAPDRAMTAGIDDIGIGVLFGLYDWKFELLAMLQHIAHLEQAFGVGPHTISVPRLEPAEGSEVASRPPHAVNDEDFRKIIAILRLAVPYTGIIMSTRENPQTRRDSFALGVSQISAGSRTNPGGYAELGDGEQSAEQFQLGDHRSLDEVIRDVASLGYIPSFCTACYRKGRTGRDFMDLAKPGLIKKHCQPNAVASFAEYLADHASPQTKAVGEALIEKHVITMEPAVRRVAESQLRRIAANERDVYV